MLYMRSDNRFVENIVIVTLANSNIIIIDYSNLTVEMLILHVSSQTLEIKKLSG